MRTKGVGTAFQPATSAFALASLQPSCCLLSSISSCRAMAQAWRSQLRAADGACSPLHRVACSRPPLGHPDASRVLQPPALTQPCSTHRPPSSIQAASEASDAPQQPATAATRDAPDRSQRTAARLQRQQAREARKGVLVPVAMPQGQGDPRERGQALEGAAVAQMLAGVTDPEERQALLASLDARAQQQLVQEFESLSPLDQQVILSVSLYTATRLTVQPSTVLTAPGQHQPPCLLCAMHTIRMDAVVALCAQAINSPYNDMSFWEEQLMEPLMQDILREVRRFYRAWPTACAQHVRRAWQYNRAPRTASLRCCCR